MTGHQYGNHHTLRLAADRQLGWSEYGLADGRGIVYCHGTPGSRWEFAPAADLAAIFGLRVIVPDRPGYGASSPSPGRTLADFADDLAALLDHLALDQTGLLGFSGGGPHALAAALRLPERINRLGLVSSLAPFSDATTVGMPESLQQFWQLAGSDAEAFLAMLNDGLESTDTPLDLLLAGAPPEDQAIFEKTGTSAYAASLTECLRPGLEGMLADAQALTSDWGITPKAPNCPVHLWHGSRDLNAPIAMGQWLSAHLGGIPLNQWADSAHFALFERWDQVLDTFDQSPSQ
ncbi:alpha/beta hydrolase [Gammaproteobacteria bacterium AB-CW1]|uniref:Alpha/beta hydrolase n=1 Tax=Natronospira elongata TaxID=3110268 RepID=A0AAP6JDA8_9GAMM|nr:alpha/beta hydrolase [Gammaproteobacteria bacterium AB-CW1]